MEHADPLRGVGGLVFLLLQPTDLGDWLLAVAPAPLAYIFRQGLFLATLVLGTVLVGAASMVHSAPVRSRRRSVDGPESSRP